jgi:predicted  nucleic acid-binding Zn-ribbon protein
MPANNDQLNERIRDIREDLKVISNTVHTSSLRQASNESSIKTLFSNMDTITVNEKQNRHDIDTMMGAQIKLAEHLATLFQLSADKKESKLQDFGVSVLKSVTSIVAAAIIIFLISRALSDITGNDVSVDDTVTLSKTARK